MIRTAVVLLALLALAGCAAGDEPATAPTQHAESEAPKIVDSGVSDAAAGSVDYDDGSPRAYTAAEGDHVDAIATRFGMTVVELEQLNPTVNSRELVPAGTVIQLR